MSHWNYAFDEQSIIAIEGLRMVTKSDSLYSYKGGRDAFFLELEYRGLSKRVEYANKETRDKIFSDLVLLLTQRALHFKQIASNSDGEYYSAVSSK